MIKIVAIVASCFLAFYANAQTSFTLSSSPAVGVNPCWVTAADLNGDGKLELVTAESGGHTLSILTNTGNGIFVKSKSLAVGNSSSVVALDVNGDGKLDLISGNAAESTLSVLTNDGVGNFFLSAEIGVSGGVNSLITADINGDGKMDLVCANYGAGGGNTLSVFTNTGTGGFMLASSPVVGAGPISVVASDINGDGKLDLICANLWSSTVSVLTNAGAGLFVLTASPPVGLHPYWVEAADINGDGKMDLITANRDDSSLTLLTNTGGGSFTFSSTLSVGNGPQSVVAVDVNGDGKVDLISANSIGNTLSVLTNNGSGGFILIPALSVGSYPVMVAAADVSGDGALDLISANYGNATISILTNKSPSLPVIATQPVGQTNVVGVAASFGVVATGLPQPNYQWRFNGTNLPAATNATLNLGSLLLSQAGIYDVVITNYVGNVTSAPALLDVRFIMIEVNGQVATGTASALAPATITLLGGYPDGYLFYTLDGSLPSASSTFYAGSFPLTNSAVIRVLSLSSDFSKTAEGVPVTVQVVPAFQLQTAIIGNGTLSTNPPGGIYASNSTVSLTATPAANWSFNHWTGDASGSLNPLSVTMNGPRNVQAVFVQSAFPLTLTAPGGGRVTANGSVIASNTYFAAQSVVTIAATASNGWSFLGWQGSISSTNNPLNLLINQTNSIQAVFGTVAATNAVGGAVLLSQPNPVPFGTQLTVSAVPDPGNYFVMWNGSLSGTNAPARISVTNPTPALGALFAPLPAGKFTLSVIVVGNGFVTNNPQRNYYNPGDNVILKATNNPGSYFFGWSQSASGTNNSILVVMNSNLTVQANFGVASTVTVSPSHLTVLAGSNAVFTAKALGLLPLTYAWQNAQGFIVGATNASYVLSNTQPASAGNYFVVVSNSSGSVTSALATLTVIGTPSITNQPLALMVTAGHAANFAVGATGWPALAYQWQLNNVNLSTATNPVLAFQNALPVNAGFYTVTVTNVYGSVTSSPVELKVMPLNIAAATKLANGQFQFNFDTANGINYQVEYSTDLLNWYPWLNIGGNGQPLTLDDPNTMGSSNRYYRIVLSPQ